MRRKSDKTAGYASESCVTVKLLLECKPDIQAAQQRQAHSIQDLSSHAEVAIILLASQATSEYYNLERAPNLAVLANTYSGF